MDHRQLLYTFTYFHEPRGCLTVVLPPSFSSVVYDRSTSGDGRAQNVLCNCTPTPCTVSTYTGCFRSGSIAARSRDSAVSSGLRQMDSSSHWARHALVLRAGRERTKIELAARAYPLAVSVEVFQDRQRRRWNIRHTVAADGHRLAVWAHAQHGRMAETHLARSSALSGRQALWPSNPTTNGRTSSSQPWGTWPP